MSMDALDAGAEKKDSAESVVDVPKKGPEKPSPSTSVVDKQRRAFDENVDQKLRELDEAKDRSLADKVLIWLGVEGGDDEAVKSDESSRVGQGQEEAGKKGKEDGERKGLWGRAKEKLSSIGKDIREKGFFAWFGSLFGWSGDKKEKKKKAVEVVEADRDSSEVSGLLNDGFEYSKGMVKTAVGSLNTALDKNPDWKGFAESAAREFKVPVPVIFSIINFESNFNASVKNPNSPALGLGQFMPKTWKGIQKYLPEALKGRDRTDPEASIFATAAYCSENAKICGIDLNAPDAALLLYLAHHEGARGYKRLMAFLDSGAKFKVPSTYFEPKDDPEKGKRFGLFDIWIKDENDCENYAKLVLRIAGQIQKVSEEYSKIL